MGNYVALASASQPWWITGDATTTRKGVKAWYFQHIGEEDVKRESKGKNES